MQYRELLKKEKKEECPLCSREYNKIISQNDKAFLTYSIAPYCKYHLLVVPKRHILQFEKLTKLEKEKIDILLHRGISDIKSLGYPDYSILIRSGEKTGRSLEHLHYHIIPSIEVSSLKNSHSKRKVMTNKEIDKLMKDFKKL